MASPQSIYDYKPGRRLDSVALWTGAEKRLCRKQKVKKCYMTFFGKGNICPKKLYYKKTVVYTEGINLPGFDGDVRHVFTKFEHT